MGGVHLVGAEHAPRGDHADGKLSLLHGAHLNRGGLASQQDRIVDIEGILLVSGRMSLGNVQLLKVVAVVLHLGAFHYLIAHAHEDALHLFQGDGIGMAVPHLVLLGRQGHVDDLAL